MSLKDFYVQAKASDVDVVSHESAETLQISNEGINGVIKAYLLGTGAAIAGVAAGGAAGVTAGIPFGPTGMFAMGGTGAVVGGTAAVGGFNAAQKAKRVRLKREIESIARRIADLRKGDIEEAKRKGIRIRKADIEPVTASDVIGSAILGTVVPFYTLYQGHKQEELQKELAEKIVELKIEFARQNITVESMNEDEFVTVADPAPVTTAIAEQEHSESRMNAQAGEEVANDHEVLTNVAEEIERLNETEGGVSVESLLLASLLTDRIGQRLGIESGLLKVPALESVSLDDRIQVSTEALNVSLEGVGAAITSFLKNQVSSAVRGWRFLATRATLRRKQYESIIKTAEKAISEGWGKDVGEVEMNYMYLHENGRVPASPMQFFTNFFNVAGKVSDNFTHDAVQNYLDFIKLAEKTTLTDPDEFPNQLKTLADGMKDARSALSRKELYDTYPGGVKFFEDKPGQYKGSSAAARKLDTFAHTAQPTRAGFQGLGESGSRAGTAKGLTPQEVKKLAEAGLASLKKIDRLRAWAESHIDSLTTVVPNPTSILSFLLAGPSAGIISAAMIAGKGATALQGNLNPTKTSKDVRKEYRAEIRALRDAHRTLHRMCFNVSGDAGSILVSVSGQVLKYMKKSLKTVE